LRFGLPDGPEVDVEIDPARMPSVPEGSVADTFAGSSRESHPIYDARQDAQRLASVLKSGAEDTSALRIADEAAHEVAERRAQVGGRSSGDTVQILARRYGLGN
jgi:hypothetical protein